MTNQITPNRTGPILKPGDVIAGFDPGSAVTGWSMVRMGRQHELLECGAIRTKSNAPLEQRLATIFDNVCERIAEYKPAIVVVEDPFMGKNVKSALTLGQARGVILLAAAKAGLEIASYPPRSIKASIVGKGSASKEQVQFMVKRLLNLRELPQPLDASDAVAVALCHIHKHKYVALGRS